VLAVAVIAGPAAVVVVAGPCPPADCQVAGPGEAGRQDEADPAAPAASLPSGRELPPHDA